MTSVPSAWPDASAPLIGEHWARPSRHGEALASALPIEFSASGSEYFRIWIVNLLLTLATLGIYYPWARVRKLRYFYANTRIAGHALDFHGRPLRMLRGYLLVGALLLLYSLAGRVSPIAGLVALVLVGALWPALLRASQQFRLANTSWRGLRFRFTGSLGGAYRAMLPLFGVVLPFFMLGALAPEGNARPSTLWLTWFAICGLIALALAPLGAWLVKKYQHDHYALGTEQTALRAGSGAFYGMSLKTLGIAMLGGFVLGVLMAIVFAAGFAGAPARGMQPGVGAAIVLPLVMLAGYVVFVAFVRAYGTSRLQNLVWSHTASRHLRFRSELRFGSLLGLTLKNWLLVALTLGLYWPFAAVALTRLRLSAMTLSSTRAADEFAGSGARGGDDASGDVAGDLFGIDIGL